MKRRAAIRDPDINPVIGGTLWITNAMRARRQFLARGLASREQARSDGQYYSVESVLAELDDILDQKK